MLKTSSGGRSGQSALVGLEKRLAGIGDTLRTLFAEADAEGVTPTEAADRLVRRRLAAA